MQFIRVAIEISKRSAVYDRFNFPENGREGLSVETATPK